MAEQENKRKAGIRSQRASDFWGTIKRMITYMSVRFWALVLAVILTIGAILLQSSAPAILGQATSEIYSGVQEGIEMMNAGEAIESFPINFDFLIDIIITLAIIFVGQAILRYIQGYIIANVAQKTVYDLRKDIKAKIATLPIKYFDTHSNGDIMSRAVNDIDQIANTLQQSLMQLMNGVIMFITVLIVMFTVNWQLALVVFITAPISGIMVVYVAPKSQRQFARQQKELGILNNQVEEIYGAHTIVKTYNQENKEIEEFKKQSAELNDASLKAQFLANIMMPLVNFARDIGYFGIGIVGGLGVLNGTMPLGHVQAFMQYVNQFSQPIRSVAQLANTIQVTIASAERIFELIDEEEMEEIDPNIEPKENTPYKVEFENVQFGYDDSPEGELLMTDFNLKVKPGQMIAIVGPTGAGKTTLINLLERFYDVKGGSIRYEGTDIRDIERDELRKIFSMVLQDTWLFNGTIRENIAYGNDKYADDEEAILTAAKAAHVDEFVRRLPSGYDTIINEEGTNISQGQKQLITIARAFLADPEILILDEATSSVDTRTEGMIQNAMNNVLQGRTSFVVAHRLSTIRDADKIIVMEQGDVVETGTHEELMEKEGAYADLYNSQFASAVPA